MKRLLVLSDGSVFSGEAFGSDTCKPGELVFQNGMCGYQEIISDQAYSHQIICITYPLIGNCGINRDDFESLTPALSGLVVKEICHTPSNFRSNMTLDEYMKIKGIPGISGVDTRAITKKLRKNGTCMATMVNEDANVDEVVEMLKNTVMEKELVKAVSTIKPFPIPGSGEKVVFVDLGMKFEMTRELNERGCDMIVVPYNTSAKEILALQPDGVFLSSGPGNPGDLPEVIEMVKELKDKTTIFGVGLGCQIIALAYGAKVEKMNHGHRGNSCPVISLKKNRVEFTMQNHGYVINEESLNGTDLEVTYRALNDKTVEGIESKNDKVSGVQFNPEAAPGANDTNYVFEEFITMMKGGK